MKALTIGLLTTTLLLAMSLTSGCSLDEIVHVDVPPNTRTHYREQLGTNVPPKLSLRDARLLRSEGDRRLEQQIKAQVADHIASNEALDREIADGGFIESLLGSAINTGIETTLPGLASVPGGAILTTLLAGLGMWFAPRPGQAKRDKQTEDKGYDLGRREALETLAKAKS